YTRSFFEGLDVLRVERAEIYPRATDHVPEMITMIEGLRDKGLTYESQGSTYYRIASFPPYGRLSAVEQRQLKDGARIESDEYEKESARDFAIWKARKDDEPAWQSPFGEGRPGWHIECSAMSLKYLGETFDIHVGGVDNMFPHHENEIAQSEAYTGKRFVKLWMHSEHLLVDGKKMSKSLGNFYTLRDLLNHGFTGRQVRYMLLHTHYRTQLNFTLAGLEAVKHSLQRLDDFIQRLQEIKSEGEEGSATSFLNQAETLFKEALADDLNISAALAALFDLIREINTLADAGR